MDFVPVPRFGPIAQRLFVSFFHLLSLLDKAIPGIGKSKAEFNF